MDSGGEVAGKMTIASREGALGDAVLDSELSTGDELAATGVLELLV